MTTQTVVLKETKEFVDALFGTIAQGVESFKDGAQITDILQFVDEAELWRKGIEGFAANFRGEALSATPELIDNLFNPQYDRLVRAGVKPILSYAIVNGMKGIFATYTVSAAGGTVS